MGKILDISHTHVYGILSLMLYLYFKTYKDLIQKIQLELKFALNHRF